MEERIWTKLSSLRLSTSQLRPRRRSSLGSIHPRHSRQPAEKQCGICNTNEVHNGSEIKVNFDHTRSNFSFDKILAYSLESSMAFPCKAVWIEGYSHLGLFQCLGPCFSVWDPVSVFGSLFQHLGPCFSIWVPV